MAKEERSEVLHTRSLSTVKIVEIQKESKVCIAQNINIARESKEVKTRAWQRRRGQGWAILFSRLRLSPARPAYHCDEADEEGEESFFVENIRWIKAGKRECKAVWCNRWSGTIKLKKKVPMVRPFNLFKHTITQSLIQSLEMVLADTEIIWKISPGLLLISATTPTPTLIRPCKSSSKKKKKKVAF